MTYQRQSFPEWLGALVASPFKDRSDSSFEARQAAANVLRRGMPAGAPSGTLEDQLVAYYIRGGMPADQARIQARQAAPSVLATSGLSEPELLQQLEDQRQRENAAAARADRSMAYQEAPTAYGTRNVPSTGQMLKGSALVDSFNPDVAARGQAAMNAAMQAASPEKVAATEAGLAQQKAVIAAKLAAGEKARAERPYDIGGLLERQSAPYSQNRMDYGDPQKMLIRMGAGQRDAGLSDYEPIYNQLEAERAAPSSYPSSAATGESIQRALEMANAKANNMEFEGSLLRNYNVPSSYNVDTQSFNSLPQINRQAAPAPLISTAPSAVDRVMEDSDELRLAKNITGPTLGATLNRQPTTPAPDQGAAPIVAPSSAGAPPLLARGAQPSAFFDQYRIANVMPPAPSMTYADRGVDRVAGADWNRTMQANMPGLFPEMPTAKAAVEVARARQAAPAPASTPSPMMRPASSPSPKDSILSRIFSGGDYQSSSPAGGDTRLYQGEKDGRKVINWGDPGSAADFFRASKAQQEWNAQNPDSPSIGAGMNRGGTVKAKPGKDDAVHKALDIIQHLLMRH
jgi:hypothetical protein